MLPLGNGTKFTITLKDSGLVPLTDYVIKLYRFYPEDNTHRLIGNKQTDSFGQAPVTVVEDNVKYRLEVYDTENILVKTEPNVYFVCRSLVNCEAQFIIQTESNLISRFGNLSDYDYSLSYNNQTGTFEFVWNDNRDDFSRHRLEITQRAFNGTTLIYNVSSSQNPGILSYTINTDNRATYTAKAIRISGGKERIIAVVSTSTSNLTDTFKLEGILWSLFLTLTMILVGRFHPPTGVILYLTMTFILGFFGILYLNPAIIVANLVIGILIIWAFQR
jgi:hypothetical protein